MRLTDNCGLIRIFTGNGKGKTTAAIGAAFRAAGEGRHVSIVQFLKGTGYTGELDAVKYICPEIQIKQFGFGCPISSQIKSGNMACTKCGICFRENRNPAHRLAPKALAFAADVINSGKADMLILDEISHAIRHKLITVHEIVAILKHKPDSLEVILTGRTMPPELITIADEITECYPHKHPMSSGLDARRGIEY